VIHTESCKNVKDIRGNSEKCVILSWDKDIDSEFSVDLRVYLEGRKGVVAELAAAITQADANIEGISVEDRDAKLSVTQLQLSVQGRKHLARVIRRLRTIRGVNKIVRIKNL
jgi:(p)ppGpp synthase/HD superfamily hydrolase